MTLVTSHDFHRSVPSLRILNASGIKNNTVAGRPGAKERPLRNRYSMRNQDTWKGPKQPKIRAQQADWRGSRNLRISSVFWWTNGSGLFPTNVRAGLRCDRSPGKRRSRSQPRAGIRIPGGGLQPQMSFHLRAELHASLCRGSGLSCFRLA